MQRAAKRAAKQFSVKKYGPLCDFWAQTERQTSEARDECVINMILCRADVQRQQIETALLMENALDKLATDEEIAVASKTEPVDSCCYTEWKEAVVIANKTRSKLHRVKVRRQNSVPNLLSFKKKEKPEFDWELSIAKTETEDETKEEDKKELPIFDWEKRRKLSRQKSMPSFLPVAPRASKAGGDYDWEKNVGKPNRATDRKRRNSVQVQKSDAVPVASSRRLSMPAALTKQLKTSKPLDVSTMEQERVKMLPGHVKMTRRNLNADEEEPPLHQKTSRRARPRRRSSSTKSMSRLSRQSSLPSLSSNATPKDASIQQKTSDRRTKPRRQSSSTKIMSRRKSFSSLAPKDTPHQEKSNRKMRSSQRKVVSRQRSCPYFDWTKELQESHPVDRKLDPFNDSAHTANTSATSGLSDTESVHYYDWEASETSTFL